MSRARHKRISIEDIQNSYEFAQARVCQIRVKPFTKQAPLCGTFHLRDAKLIVEYLMKDFPKLQFKIHREKSGGFCGGPHTILLLPQEVG